MKKTNHSLWSGGIKAISHDAIQLFVLNARDTHLHTLVDVAVIDEVQMIKDYDRGGAWTKAILGIPAAEVHLCGHQCAVNLLEKITSTIGEKLEVSVTEMAYWTGANAHIHWGGGGFVPT